MAKSKQNVFPVDEAALAAWAKALSHPARAAILKVLAAKGTCICGEIVEVLPLAQATVSQHLRVLKDAGLLQGTVDGPRSCYCVDREKLKAAQQAFSTFFSDVLNAANCC